MAQKKWKGSREEKENCGGAESDDVVAEESDGGGGDAASVGIAAEEAGSDVVKDASGADVEHVAVDDEGGGDVERAAGQAGEQDGGEGVGGGGGLRHVFSVEVEIILDVGMRSSVRGGALMELWKFVHLERGGALPLRRLGDESRFWSGLQHCCT